jgi:hypothetical protein
MRARVAHAGKEVGPVQGIQDLEELRNLVPHYSIYNFGRMQGVWLDRSLAYGYGRSLTPVALGRMP